MHLATAVGCTSLAETNSVSQSFIPITNTEERILQSTLFQNLITEHTRADCVQGSGLEQAASSELQSHLSEEALEEGSGQHVPGNGVCDGGEDPVELP